MQIKIQNFWYRLQASFWFLPALMAVGAILLSVITTAIDKEILYQKDVRQWWL
jgi:uncharacterized membrane protein